MVQADINISTSGGWFKGLPWRMVARRILDRFLAKWRLTHPESRIIVPSTLSSTEGIIQFLDENRYITEWIPELTSSLKSGFQTKTVTYQPKLEFYTNLLDCEPIERRLTKKYKSKTEEEKQQYEWFIERYRYNQISATTDYIFEVTDKYIASSGYVCRANTEWNAGLNPKIPPLDIVNVDWKQNEQLNERLDSYVDFLVAINQRINENIYIGFIDGEMLHDYMVEMRVVEAEDEWSPTDREIIRSYQVRNWMKAVVKAQLYYIGDFWDNWIKTGTIPEIPDQMLTKRHLEYGIKRVANNVTNMKLILNAWNRKLEEKFIEKKKPAVDVAVNVQKKLFEMLKQAGPKGLPLQALTTSLGQSAEKYLQQLAFRGLAFVTQKKFHETDTKSSQVWCLMEFSGTQ
jgi:hypothetical protein